MSFESDNDYLGQTLSKLISKANLTLAEILKVKCEIPLVFRSPSKRDKEKYGDILELDLGYLQNPTNNEAKLGKKLKNLEELDRQLRDRYLEVVTKVYRLLVSIYKHVTDLIKYVNSLEEGIFVKQKLDTIFFDKEGKKLLCEALYFTGVILLQLDQNLEGNVRETILVLAFRWASNKFSESDQFSDICNLFKSTHFKAGKKLPPNYPESLFSRINISENYVKMVIGRLLSDDLYGHAKIYPDPDHLTTALSPQASMMCISLHFCPKILKDQTDLMKEIVRKFFVDNWVINFNYGEPISLFEWWEPYKAARVAITEVITSETLTNVVQRHSLNLKGFVSDGSELKVDLDEGKVLDHFVPRLNLMQDCNVTLKWLLLHTHVNQKLGNQYLPKHLREVMSKNKGVSSQDIFEFLLLLSRFEVKLISIYGELLCEKTNRLIEMKKSCIEHLEKLEAMEDSATNDRLAKVLRSFENIFDFKTSELVDLMSYLDLILEEDNYDSTFKEKIMKVVSKITDMMRLANVKESVLRNLHFVISCNYAWNILHQYDFVAFVEEKVKENPQFVLTLNYLFLKLYLTLTNPIINIGAKEMKTSRQFSAEKVLDFASMVLKVIPESLFSMALDIVHLYPEDLSQYNNNNDYEIAKLRYKLASLVEGMMLLKTMEFGNNPDDNVKILRKGIRTQLESHLIEAINSTVNSKNKNTSLSKTLTFISKKMKELRRAVEILQVYISMPGLQIWHQEVSKIFMAILHQEADTVVELTTPGILNQIYQQLVQLTSPKYAVYIEVKQSWYNIRSGKMAANLGLFASIEKAIEVTGLQCLDKFMQQNMVAKIETIDSVLNKSITNNRKWAEILTNLSDSLNPIENIVAQPMNFYHSFVNRGTKLLNSLQDEIASLGLLFILRKLIYSQLKFSFKRNSPTIHSLLENLMSNQTPGDKLIKRENFNQLAEESGLIDEDKVIYSNLSPISSLSEVLFLELIHVLAKLSFSDTFGELISKRTSENLDGPTFMLGMLCVLRHYPEYISKSVVLYLSQYARSFAEVVSLSSELDIAEEIQNSAIFLDKLSRDQPNLKDFILSQLPNSEVPLIPRL